MSRVGTPPGREQARPDGPTGPPGERKGGRWPLPPLATLLPLPAVGCGIGMLAGLFGIGGGVLAVPALTLLMHKSQHLAEGTSLAVILPTTALGAYRYARRGSVRWAAAAVIGGAAAVTGFATAHVALGLPGALLRDLFACFLLLLAWRTASAARPRRSAPDGAGGAAAPPARPPSWLRRQAVAGQAGIGLVVGALAGLLGVGGGTIVIPGLVLLYDFTAQAAQGTSLAALVLSSASGAAGYAVAGSVDWVAAVALFAGAAITVPLGARIAHRLPDRQLRRVFAAFLVAVAAAQVASRL